MAETNFVEDGIDRVQSAFQSVEDEFEKLQKRVDRGRKDFEKQTEQRVKSWQKELRQYSIVRRAEELQEDVSKRIESGLDAVLSNLQIATRGDMKKIDRKLNQISRKLKALEKDRVADSKAAA